MERKKRKRIILLAIAIVIASLLGYYIYRIKSADLLTDWSTPSQLIIPGFSQYHVINSKTGESTYLPSFLLKTVNSNNYDEWTYEERKEISSHIIESYPSWSGKLGIYEGQLGDNTIVISVDFGDGYESVVLYDLSTDTYKVAVQTNGIVSVIAGQGKIFILTLPVVVPWETSILPAGTVTDSNEISASNYYQPIYLYDPNTEEITKIGEYNAFVNRRSITLEAVLK